MGRPREHDQQTLSALLAAAEDLVGAGGPDALSVRAVADEVGTTTRAVYSLFGSKDGLIAALAKRAFDLLHDAIEQSLDTGDPASDVVSLGVTTFRGFVREHPALFRIAFQRIVPELLSRPEVVEARQRALPLLVAKMQRLKDAGRLPNRSVMEAAMEFNAMCEGLANAELRGTILSIMPAGKEELAWRGSLETVVAGWSARARRRGPVKRPGVPQQRRHRDT